MLNWHTVSNFLSFLEKPRNVCFYSKVFVHDLAVLHLDEGSPFFVAALGTDFPLVSGNSIFVEKIILVTFRRSCNSKRFIKTFH